MFPSTLRCISMPLPRACMVLLRAIVISLFQGAELTTLGREVSRGDRFPAGRPAPTYSLTREARLFIKA